MVAEIASFEFPVGYHAFHPKQLYNFQLNRWHSLGYLPRGDMAEAGKQVSSFATWTAEMQARGDEALQRNNLVHAAFFYRAEEFYTIPARQREALYERFSALLPRIRRGRHRNTRGAVPRRLFARYAAQTLGEWPASGHDCATRRIRLVHRGVLLDDAVPRGCGL